MNTNCKSLCMKLEGLTGTIHVKHLQQCLSHTWFSVNVAIMLIKVALSLMCDKYT